MTPELHELTIAQARELIQRKSLSPVEYASALLDRIDSLDSNVNAFITVTRERALAQARQAEREIMRGVCRGPMHGVPFAVKDVIDTAGTLTSGHSKVAMANIPKGNAQVVDRLEQAGAVLLGKVATHEFAFGGCFDLPWPPARNPWNLDHFTGGSSSGSAAAIAAGFVPAAIGTDTGGSIRTPSSLCGITGLKPTFGVVSCHGVITNSFSFDHVGPMAWNVEDCAILLDTISGYDRKYPGTARRRLRHVHEQLSGDIAGLRIGVLRHFWDRDMQGQPDVVAAMEEALRVLEGLGAKLQDKTLPALQDIYDAKMVIAESELFAIHQHNLSTRIADFGPEFVTRSIPACLFSSVDYVHAQRRRRRLIDAAREVYDSVDAFVTICSGPAPSLGGFRAGTKMPGVVGAGIDFWQRPSLTTPFNLLGGPAITVCTGFNPRGLPLAMQVAGKPFSDPIVLRIAHAYERAASWRTGRPKLAPNVKGAEIPPAPAQELPAVEPALRTRVEDIVARAGLSLNESQLLNLCVTAPYAWEMARRCREPLPWYAEPASIFTTAPVARANPRRTKRPEVTT